MNEETLFRQKNTWYHYIGGYYQTTNRFVKEAKKLGVTRRAPVQTVRGMNFGDNIILLRYSQGDSYAFAEMTITKITLDNEIADAVGQKLKDDGRAEYQQGGGVVKRDCGEFCIGGTWVVEADIAEIMDLASQIAAKQGIKISVMVGGELTRVYDTPQLVTPSPKFTRGFTRIDDQTDFIFSDTNKPGQIVAIDSYRQAERRSNRRKSSQPTPGQMALI